MPRLGSKVKRASYALLLLARVALGPEERNGVRHGVLHCHSSSSLIIAGARSSFSF
jgi:hypothetical protein